MMSQPPDLKKGEMPPIGIGTVHIRATNMDSVLRTAILTAKIRHIDCAKVYGNEGPVGKALQSIFAAGEVTREDMFITSKLWNDDHRLVEQACRASLQRLQLEQLDLYLIHWPTPWRKGTVFCPDDEVTLEDTWRAMESLVDKGLTRYIGLSNFDETNTKRILAMCRIKPYANQLEIHPRLAQRKLVKFCQDNDIKVVAWSPIAKFNGLANNPTLMRIADRVQRSIVQVVLRWHYQHGVVTIPRSSKPSRLVSNAQIFDFTLSDEEMRAIDALDENRRLIHDWLGVFDTTPRFPYKFPIGYLVGMLFKFIFFFVPNKIDLHGNPFTK